MSGFDPSAVAALRAALADMSGFTLWRTHQGWQASARVVGSDGWRVTTASDPAEAVLRALGLYGMAENNGVFE